MRAPWLLTLPEAGRLLPQLGAVPRLVHSWLPSPVFWRVQGVVVLITLAYYLLEGMTRGTSVAELHYIVPVLYAFPIALSGRHFRREGARFTALLSVLLALPEIILGEQFGALERLLELMQLSVGVVLGLILSRLVDHEAVERQRAQERSFHLAVLHRHVTRAQEDERRRIARELHDQTVQSLIVLCRGLDSAAAVRRLPRATLGLLHNLRAIADDVLADVRRVSRDLRPTVLDDLGLVSAVEWLAAELAKRHGIPVRVEVTGIRPRLPAETELALFRIVQEGLHNVEKHAAASEVVVVLAFAAGSFRVSVRDNGKGFHKPLTLHGLVPDGKLGLVGMHERAELLGGTLDLQSTVGKGTCLTVTLPAGEDIAPAAKVHRIENLPPISFNDPDPVTA